MRLASFRCQASGGSSHGFLFLWVLCPCVPKTECRCPRTLTYLGLPVTLPSSLLPLTCNMATSTSKTLGPKAQQEISNLIARHIPTTIFSGQFTVKPFTFGQSNPTFLLTSENNQRLVLRKQPSGSLVKSAHDVEREFRVLCALQVTAVPVPKPFILCKNASLIGGMFYIMEYLEGRIFKDPAMPGMSALERSQAYASAVQVLANLHSLSPRSLGLQSLASTTPYYERQAKRFRAVSALQAKHAAPLKGMQQCTLSMLRGCPHVTTALLPLCQALVNCWMR